MTEAGPKKKTSSQKCDQMGTTNPFEAFMPNIAFPPNSIVLNEGKIVAQKRKTDAKEEKPDAKQVKKVAKKVPTDPCDEKPVAKKGKTNTQEGKVIAKKPDAKKVTGNADASFRPIIWIVRLRSGNFHRQNVVLLFYFNQCDRICL